MTAHIELVNENDPKLKPRRVEVEFRCPDRRSKTLDAIDKAVVKQFKDDPNWTRWNLVNLTGI